MPPAGAWEHLEHPLDLDRPRPTLDGLSLRTLAALPFEGLCRFRSTGRWPHGQPADRAAFYSPHDPGLHAVEAWTHMQVDPHLGSLRKNMYGFDDPLLASIVRYWCEQPGVVVTVNLDRTQAGSKTEQEILALLLHGEAGNSVAIGDLHATRPPAKRAVDPLAPPPAIAAPGDFAPTPAPGATSWGDERIAEGTSSSAGAISHLKLDIVDDRIKTGGSTNQSQGGELRQDNELTVETNVALVRQAATIVDLNHRTMLAQMRARHQIGADQ